MKPSQTDPFDALEKVFHEPNRMAILSVLCTSNEGVPFTELRDRCGLTDGNLSRHVKTLEEAGIVRCKKAFVNDKPRTTVSLTSGGTKRFQAYLDALAAVLKQAKNAMRRESSGDSAPAVRLATT